LKEDEKNEEVSWFSSENAKESISMRKPVQKKSHATASLKISSGCVRVNCQSISISDAPVPNRAPGDSCTVNPMMAKDSGDERELRPGLL
jgi:hypothetical protein